MMLRRRSFDFISAGGLRGLNAPEQKLVAWKGCWA
jgi:hypothetical protein